MIPIKPRTHDAFLAVRRGHRRDVELRLWQPGGQVGVLPISTGDLTVSLSQQQQQSGKLRVPGYGWWEHLRPAANTWIEPVISIDGEPFGLGQWPVLRAVPHRPEGIIEVTLGDWAYRRSRSKAEIATETGVGTLAQMIPFWMNPVMPVNVTVVRDDTGGAALASSLRIQLGADIWSVMTEAANQRGAIIRMLTRGTAEVRVFDPLAPPVEDLGGTMNTEISGELGDEAINRVVVVVESEASTGPTFRAVRTLTTGPYAYNKAGFGLGVLTEMLRVPVASQAIADAQAKRLADRRFGVVRTLEVEVVAQPWLEVGDVVSLDTTTAAGPEHWMVDTVTYPLTAAGRMRLVMREVQAT